MHPFFKPVLTKTNRSPIDHHAGQQEEPTAQKNKGVLQHHGRQTYTDSNGLGDSSDAFRNQDFDLSNDHGETENVDIDPNSDRKKRQKTTFFEESEIASSQKSPKNLLAAGGSWLAQLQAAATSGSTESQAQQEPEASTRPSPLTPQSASPLTLAIRKSPMKTPAKLQFAPDVPMATPPNVIRPTTRSSSSGSKRAPSPGLSPTPKKKIIKLTSKGKLLSSPASVSPAIKHKTRSKQIQPIGKTAFVPRSSTRLSYGEDAESRKLVGSQINAILAQGSRSIGQDSDKPREPEKITHPFFLGRPSKKPTSDLIVIDDDSVIGQESDADEKSGNGPAIKPKDWDDLGFKKNEISVVQLVDAIRTLWPPKGMQHLGVVVGLPDVQQDRHTSMIRQRSSKSKVELLNVPTDEDIIHQFAATLSVEPGQLVDTFPLPHKMALSRQRMLNTMKTNRQSTSEHHAGANKLQDAFPHAFTRMQSNLMLERSSKDVQGAGTARSWLLTSAPQQTNQVLQSQTSMLQKWLASHQVQHTAIKLSAARKVEAPRRRRRRKKAEDLDDFIASSDGDEDSPGLTKNAILITGPSGCGKTASVYAAAKELDFVVFEIYPGMRRSAKDIFEKVGDMTQNHLVHKATQFDDRRGSSPGDVTQASKIAMKTFLGGKKAGTKKSADSQSRPGTPKDDVGVKSQSQKQSLILFEEVDILFEEDRGFWSGVIQLIESSKRPVILTCNDSSSVPMEDLPLHATLLYEPIPLNVAVDYILLLAASEGHSLRREAVRLLYLSKKNDLRATIAELSFWCQMAVGSEKAGLDWMVSPRSFGEAGSEKTTVFSKDTYLPGMGMVPRTLLGSSLSTHAALLQYSEDELGIPLQHWHEECDGGDARDTSTLPSSASSRLHALHKHLELAETRSVLDLLNQPADARCDTDHIRQTTISAYIAASALRVFTPRAAPVSAVDITHAHLQARGVKSQSASTSVLTTFEPLMTEKTRFPPSTGRLAPSLEMWSRYLVADIAPYIRSIVRYDQRLELQREAMGGGSQGIKTRKTRASRAALEGGSKASTREEKWFPRGTDYAAVLETGGEWRWWEDEFTRLSSDESLRGTESRTESTVASPGADVEMTDDA